MVAADASLGVARLGKVMMQFGANWCKFDLGIQNVFNLFSN
jgi:hypothetical protein